MTPAPPLVPTVGALVTKIAGLLPTATPTSLTTASRASDVYEGYGFALAVAAAGDIGMTVTFEDTSGTAFVPSATSPVTLRTSPSSITSGDYTHAVLSADGVELFELHTGIFIRGASRAQHECDVVLLRRAEGIAARAFTPGSPKAAGVVWALEAKFYDAATVGIDTGREYLGLNADVGGGSSRRTSIYVTKCRDSVRKLLAHHGRVGTLFVGVGPTSIAEDNLRSHLRGVLAHAWAAAR